MSDENNRAEKAADAVAEQPAKAPAKTSMDPIRKWVLVCYAIAAVLLVWYLFADRLTPFTSQARVHAFVVPVSAETTGQLLSVNVSNNAFVKQGQLLARIDPEQSALALASAEAQLVIVQQNLRAASAAVGAAEAAVRSAHANRTKQRQNRARLHRIYDTDPGAVSQRLVESADASFAEAEANHAQAEANLAKAMEQRGPADDSNPQLLAARAAVGQAQRNLRKTDLIAPADGLVTDLQVATGNLAQPGRPLMTFISINEVWVQADLTENNIGNIAPGAPVELVLDVAPGHVLQGKVRNITYGVHAAETTSTPGALPTVQNQRNWLRDAQRFPVLIDLDNPQEAVRLGMRVGSQASVIVYAGGNPMLDLLGAGLIRLSSLFSYAY